MGGKNSLLTKKEVAEFLRVSERTVDRLTETGALNFFKIGGAKRFGRSDVESFLEVSKMTKMDKIWVALANLIHPQTSQNILMTSRDIVGEVQRIFPGTDITPVMLEKHLVSWEDRMADKKIPARGGSRNRYLFRTDNGSTPSASGDFRLYKRTDAPHDGWEKTGKICPGPNDVLPQYRTLISWHQNHYF
jgi:excisionase family DNA binding protein